jgi:hypothetical protein
MMVPTPAADRLPIGMVTTAWWSATRLARRRNYSARLRVREGRNGLFHIRHDGVGGASTFLDLLEVGRKHVSRY